jgi:hypothetical protein
MLTAPLASEPQPPHDAAPAPAQRRSKLRLPALSIRAAVLLAIVLGVVLPALALLLIDERVARGVHEPLIQRNRDAVFTLATAALAEPLAYGHVEGLRAALQTVMRDPSVCAVELSASGVIAAPLVLQHCPSTQPVVQRQAELRADSAVAGTLRIAFDDREIERLLSERRSSVLRQVIVQVIVGVAVLLGVLSLRLLRPIDQLKAIASAIAARTTPPPLSWRRRDELGQLARHLNDVRLHIQELFDELERKNAQLRKMAMSTSRSCAASRCVTKVSRGNAAASADCQARCSSAPPLTHNKMLMPRSFAQSRSAELKPSRC